MSGVETVRPPARLPRTGILAPDGREFAWGPIDAIHEIGPYAVVEYRCDKSNHSPSQPWAYAEHGKTRFHPFIDGRDTNCSYQTLDSALVGAIGRAREGANSRAARYFDLMTLGEIPGEDDGS